jgi:hypothetical protein
MSTLDLQPTFHIGRVIRDAATFNIKNWREANVNTDSLLQTVKRLFALLRERQVDYLLVGGIALLRYIEGRNTEDIDLIMAAASFGKLPEIKISPQDIDFARGEFDGLRIDILLTRNPLFEAVRQQHATLQPFVEQAIPCATVEGLLLLKLYALPSLYRQGHFARVSLYENDIAMLLHDYQPPIEPLLDELAKYISETDLTSLREILAEIQARIARFGRGLPNSSG